MLNVGKTLKGAGQVSWGNGKEEWGKHNREEWRYRQGMGRPNRRAMQEFLKRVSAWQKEENVRVSKRNTRRGELGHPASPAQEEKKEGDAIGGRIVGVGWSTDLWKD